jgi:metalloendopeptidase OMA1, mitochondrial
MVHGASWPPRRERGELGQVIVERERLGRQYQPSAVAKSGFMPFRPESGNPLKVLQDGDWNLYVVDFVSFWGGREGSLAFGS